MDLTGYSCGQRCNAYSRRRRERLLMGVHLPCEDLVPFISKMNNRFVCGCLVVVFRYMRGRLGVLDKVGDGIIYVGVNGQCLRANARLVPSSK